MNIRFLWPCIVSKAWRERKTRQDATIRCLLSTSVSTCFGHHYAHLQENKRPCYCIWCTALVLLDVVGSGCGALRCRMRAVLASYSACPKHVETEVDNKHLIVASCRFFFFLQCVLAVCVTLCSVTLFIGMCSVFTTRPNMHKLYILPTECISFILQLSCFFMV